jgi:manganese/iron transport system ATP-binding protein
MGFLRPTGGAVTVAGLPVREAQKRNLVAYVPQTEDVDWNFPVSVWDVVMMGRYGHMNMFRISSREDRRIAEESLNRVSMGISRRQIGELSGGQKKRVFFARAGAAGPVLLLDEPFTGVDVVPKRDHQLLQSSPTGHIIPVSTHNLGSVPEFCDRSSSLIRWCSPSAPPTSSSEENLAPPAACCAIPLITPTSPPKLARTIASSSATTNAR